MDKYNLYTGDKLVFTIEGSQYAKFKKFAEEHKNCPWINLHENFKFTLTPTTVGFYGHVKCRCGATLDLTDWDLFPLG